MGLFPWSLVVIGVAALAAGVVGALVPSGYRLEVLLSLVAGAGAGVVVLGLGLALKPVETPTDRFDGLFFVGSCVGAAAVAAVLALIWRRTAVERRSS
jgi:hypothetical protein